VEDKIKMGLFEIVQNKWTVDETKVPSDMQALLLALNRDREVREYLGRTNKVLTVYYGGLHKDSMNLHHDGLHWEDLERSMTDRLPLDRYQEFARTIEAEYSTLQVAKKVEEELRKIAHSF